MQFKDWLIESNIIFTRLQNDGVVVVNIDGKEYVYDVDTAIFPELKRLIKYKPGTALNLVKKHSQQAPDLTGSTPIRTKEILDRLQFGPKHKQLELFK